jgi:hypothetical protein
MSYLLHIYIYISAIINQRTVLMHGVIAVENKRQLKDKAGPVGQHDLMGLYSASITVTVRFKARTASSSQTLWP